ncbi:MAG: recombinase family protein [Actinomycetota bacterium]|nr:recombinase family protein [Actinomycetota bacterium]
MPSTNGHGPKRAILYARVSTDEQARSGYSLAQQLEALREYANREGYEVLEEVSDPGQSGASLERPGMDRVRDLVAAGGVSVVLAQDRDRFAREPAYHYLLRREFEEHGTKIRALNDRGDESPEGELTDGILDQLAKYERAKIAERTRRGKLRKAREGKIVTPIPNYGFRLNETGDALVVFEPEMRVVEKIMRWAAGGLGMVAMQSRLYAEGIPSPKGKEVWNRPVIKRVVEGDIYRPHSFAEIIEMVSPEAATGLDADLHYGVQWFNRDKVTMHPTSEPDGNGGRRYRKKRTSRRRPREEWVAIPVPTSPLLTRDLVDLARATLGANVGSERKHLAREWELSGMIRCSCGASMQTKSTNPEKNKKVYRYYYCVRRNKLSKMCGCRQQALRVEEVEPVIWEFVSGLLLDPERIRAGMNRLIDQERATRRDDLEGEARAWSEKLEECVRLRGAYQDQQAAGLMTIEELRSKLTALEETRRHAEAELLALKDSQHRAEQLERDRDALLESMADTVPGALEELTGLERNQVYRLLRLRVSPTAEGFEVSGALTGILHYKSNAQASLPGTVSGRAL